MIISAILLAVALSMDSFVVGILYGMRRIKIPLPSLFILGICSAGGFGASMLLGETVASQLSQNIGHFAGGMILLCIGSWRLLEAWPRYVREKAAHAGGEPPVVQMRIRSVGVVIQILIDPVQADADFSGTIETKEAFMLGMALGLDGLAGGFAAAMIGYGMVIIPLVAGAAMASVLLGMGVGGRLGHRFFKGKGIFLPGLVLIVMGLFHL